MFLIHIHNPMIIVDNLICDVNLLHFIFQSIIGLAQLY